MKMLISDLVLHRIDTFAEKYSDAMPVLDELKITVSLGALSLIFLQPERYSQAVTCHITFAQDIGFFFEEVRAALDGKQGNLGISPNENTAHEEFFRMNNQYVLEVLKYCEENINLIKSMPPSWFPKAVQISYVATRKYFPDMADTDLQRKKSLMESLAWRESVDLYDFTTSRKLIRLQTKAR